MTHAAPAHTDLKGTLEEMRASVAREGTREGLAGMVQDVFLKLLEMLLALLTEFRAGTLVLPGAGARAEADAPCGDEPCPLVTAPASAGMTGGRIAASARTATKTAGATPPAQASAPPAGAPPAPPAQAAPKLRRRGAPFTRVPRPSTISTAHAKPHHFVASPNLKNRLRAVRFGTLN